jgi:hypothetical protein
MSELSCVSQWYDQIEYVAEPEALEFRETQNINPEDFITLERDLTEMGIKFEDEDEE